MKYQDIPGKYKAIEGFEDYFITEFGEVYSIRLRGNEKEPHLHKLTPKNPGNYKKYLNIILCNDTGRTTKSIHRLVAKAFVDGCFDGAVVNHIDGNNRNNNATNLEWITTEDNIHKSYLTSGVSSVRNWKIWRLIDKDGVKVGDFVGHYEMETFVKAAKINASPTQLTKKGNSRGYKVIKYSDKDRTL